MATKLDKIPDKYSLIISHYCGNHTFIEATPLKDVVGFPNKEHILQIVHIGMKILIANRRVVPSLSGPEGSSCSLQASLGSL